MYLYEPPFLDDHHGDLTREWFPPEEPYRDSYDIVDGEPATRLTHLVLVDGRLVDMWQEAVTGTRWEHHARKFDEQLRRPAPPPPPPPKPLYVRALAWLDDLCGGREAVQALDTAPLTDDALDLPEIRDVAARSRLQAVAELLDAVAERWFDDEAAYACRRALLHLWDAEPEVVLDAATAAHVAGGIAWVVGKANGLLHPQGPVRVTSLKDALVLGATPSTYGKVVQAGLRGLRERSADATYPPTGQVDLLPTRHADLLVSSVRRRLVRLRERALEAQAEASVDPP